MKNFIVNFEWDKWIAFTSKEAAQEYILSVAEEEVYETFCEITNLGGVDIETYFKDQERHMKRVDVYRKPFATLSGYQLWRNGFAEIIEVEVFD